MEILSIIGFATTVIALVAAYYFYRKSSQESMFLFNNKIQVIIGESANRVSNMEIKIGDILVTNVYVEDWVFWCSGNKYIDGNDISNVDQIRIAVPKGVEILDYKLESQTHDRVRANLIKRNNNIIITFDYLEPGDGAKLSLIYWNKGDNDDAIEMRGTIKGIPDFGELQHAPLYHIVNGARKLSVVFTGIAISASMLSLIIGGALRLFELRVQYIDIANDYILDSNIPTFLLIAGFVVYMGLRTIGGRLKEGRISIPSEYREFVSKYWRD